MSGLEPRFLVKGKKLPVQAVRDRKPAGEQEADEKPAALPLIGRRNGRSGTADQRLAENPREEGRLARRARCRAPRNRKESV